MRVTSGSTRTIFLFKHYVIKVPRPIRWNNFLQGLLSNMTESLLYKWHDYNHLLCPVLWSSWGGWILIMRRADVERHIQEVKNGRLFNYSSFINTGLGGDDKPANYGYIGDVLVKVDYGS